jgi:hypothetical protein
MTWSRFPILAALFLVLTLVSACAGPVAPPASGPAPAAQALPQPEPEPEKDILPGFKGTLKDFLGQTLKAQYSAALNLYTPPPDGLEKDFHLQLNLEPATLILGNGVTAYAAGENGRAMGFATGKVRVFSPFQCPEITLPGGSGVSMISWLPGSPLMAALGAECKDVFVFDLRRGAEIAERNFNSTLAAVSLSSRGTWLAVADGVHDLWVGPGAGGPMTKVASLRYEPIGLSFTPQEGLLMAVDAAGWITIWAPLTKKLVDKVQVPSGPFARAEFSDSTIILFPKEGEPVRWDILAKRVMTGESAPSPFSLRNGVLTYKTYSPRPVKKVHMAPAELRVEFSPGQKLVRVRDIDRETRFYGLDGNPAAKSESPDFEPVPVDPDGRFQIKDRKFALAERIFQKEHAELLCRFLPGKGYFLWWKNAPRPMEFNPKPGELPRRTGISANEPAVWTPVEPSDQFL